MGKFIELTDFQGNTIMVANDDISTIKQVNNPVFTAITTKSGLLIEVLQSYEAIYELLTKNY